MLRGSGPLRRPGAPEVPPPPPPPPPVNTTLPFAETTLRAGYVTYTPANNAILANVLARDFIVPTTQDALIDMQWLEWKVAMKVWVRGGQRVHVKNVRINSDGSGTSAYSRGGFGFRMQSGQSSPAGHCSLTGALIYGTGLADGLTIGGTTDPYPIDKVTFQKVRLENASMSNGGVAASEPAEHMDAFQAQGPFTVVEFGLCTLHQQWAKAGLDPGKGFMLNAYSQNNQTYLVDLNKVNFRDFPGATNCGAWWIKDFNKTSMRLVEVYGYTESNKSSSWAWAANSGMFLNTATQSAANQGWTSTGNAPNRVASFPAVVAITGTVQEGLPAGGDFVTRAALGF